MKEDFLAHYGIKGQKWGVRRFQNPDGTLTEEGKWRDRYRRRQVNAWKTHDQVEDIIKTWNKKDRELFDLRYDDEPYMTLEQGSNVAKRVLISEGNTPVAFFDLLEAGEDPHELTVALGTRSGDEYRNKGYAREAAKKGMEWYEKNKERLEYNMIYWSPRIDNAASVHLAEKHGFVRDESSYSDDGKWVNYVKR